MVLVSGLLAGNAIPVSLILIRKILCSHWNHEAPFFMRVFLFFSCFLLMCLYYHLSFNLSMLFRIFFHLFLFYFIILCCIFLYFITYYDFS